MKKKYTIEDDKIIELDDNEYLNYPKNARLKLIDKVDEKRIEPSIQKNDYEQELRNLIGLSINRTRKVMDKFDTKDELMKNLKNLPFSEIENKTIKDYYAKHKQSTNKKNKGDN